jgi:O-antigen/teichoic acid export membrane protein
MTTDPPEPGRHNGEALREAGEPVDAGIKRRASAALFLVGSWGLANLVTAFLGNLVLARLLDPKAFGTVAVGATVLIIVSAFAEGGLASALIRRPEPPTEPELRTLTGLQLCITIPLALLVAAFALPFGEIGQVTALMVLAVPIGTLQAAGRIGLARDIRMRQITAVDATSVLGYYGWSITAVAVFDLGVWGLATGTVFRSICGVVAMAVVPRGGVRRPTLELIRSVGPLIRFGVRFQANWLAIVGREQGVNAVTGIVGGLYTLGLWSLASRLVQVPSVLYEAIGRVTFPAMSHLLARDRDPRPLIERTARLSATASAVFLSAFAAGAPGYVPGLFGTKWEEIVPLLPCASIALMVSGTFATASVGFLFAANRPEIVLRSSIAYGLTWCVATAILLPVVGLVGLGVGWVLGTLAEGAVLVPAVRKLAGARISAALAIPLSVATVGGTAGWITTIASGSTLPAAVLGSLSAALITIAGLLLLSRAVTIDLFGVALRSARDAVGRDPSGGAERTAGAS